MSDSAREWQMVRGLAPYAFCTVYSKRVYSVTAIYTFGSQDPNSTQESRVHSRLSMCACVRLKFRPQDRRLALSFPVAPRRSPIMCDDDPFEFM